MDFFKDFSDISSTPIYSKYNQQTAQRNKNVKFGSTNAKKDQFDDLLSDLMSKQQIKKSRKNIQPYSSQNLGSAMNVDSFGKTTQKFYNQNIQTQHNLNFGLSREGNKGSKKSILDDLMSEDNKSMKSGTARRDNQANQSINFTKNLQPTSNNPLSQNNIGGRAGMRPPLKKKAQSRQPSIFNDDNKSVSRFNDNMGSIQDLQILSVSPKMPKRHTVQPDRVQQSEQVLKFDLTASKQKQAFKPFEPQKSKQPQKFGSIINQTPIIQQKIIQKVITIKQDNKQVSARHQQQIKLIKESYQRQIQNLKENYEKILKQQQNNRKIIIKTYQESIQMQKRKWQKMMKQENERIKELHEWQSRKKTQSYELEVRKLKQLVETITKNQQKNKPSQHSNIINQQSSIQLTLKIKQLQQQRQRIEQQKIIIQTKRRQLQSEQHEFDLYKRRQQNKINQQRKKLFQYQTQIRKRQLQMKKDILNQKQSLAAQLVNSQINLNKIKQNIKHQTEKLNLQKQLFNQQKIQYEKINHRILNDLKQRQKILQVQKEQTHQLQIQLYKKINTIQFMAVQKGISNHKINQSLNHNQSLNYQNQSLNHTKKRPQTAYHRESFNQQNYKQNNRNRINSELNKKISQTKGRYQQIQQIARSNSVHKQTLRQDTHKIHLQKYIEKLTKDKLKIIKY